MDRLKTYGISETRTAGTIRVRIQHGHTLKDGWRLTETTVEYTGETIDWDRIESELRMANIIGGAESATRNQFETGRLEAA